MPGSTLAVSDETRREVNKLKYELGHSSVDETVEFLLEGVDDV